ncbi:YigZ family protein [Erysipelothrix sp. HDW6C]|uniref:IMPACT family protein n=1 Tax=Erysipelothrix sp. HDW6C TaxID=2714930 RepID=UPI001F0FF245|nr:YigZ family protein [Erysipelothrix sp. HDW6C]
MEKLDYKTIAKNVVTEQEIIKSKFITYLAPIATEEAGKLFLKSIKKEHPKASHHCSAFIVGDIERSNDDGEPASSAGLPMLQVLRGNKMQGVIAVVVRYFGGTELGVGGLIRAYGSSVTQAIQAAEILYPQRVFTYAVTFPYEFINDVEVLVADIGEVIDRHYDALVRYDIRVTNPESLEPLNDICRGQAVSECIKDDIELIKEVS